MAGNFARRQPKERKTRLFEPAFRRLVGLAQDWIDEAKRQRVRREFERVLERLFCPAVLASLDLRSHSAFWFLKFYLWCLFSDWQVNLFPRYFWTSVYILLVAAALLGAWGKTAEISGSTEAEKTAWSNANALSFPCPNPAGGRWLMTGIPEDARHPNARTDFVLSFVLH